MRRVVGVLFLLILAVRPVAAGRMLIATAASDGEIDRFCLTDDGRFTTGDPRPSIALRQENPHVMLFVPEDRPGQTDVGVLYVADPDRVEAIRFGPNGDVTSRGQTEVNENMDPRAIVVDSTTRMLYVAQHGLDRITAYQLDENGLPPDPPKVCVGGTNIGMACKNETEDVDCPGSKCEAPKPFSSCAQGRLSSGYNDVILESAGTTPRPSTARGLLYVAAEAGRVDVFGTLADGRICSCAPCEPAGAADCTRKESCALTDACIPTTPEECPKGTDFDPTTPLLQRRKLNDPTKLFLSDGTLIVQESGVHRLVSFNAADLQPAPPRACDGGTNKGMPCNTADEATACPSSFCTTQNVCVGGVNIGKVCKNATEATDCPGSECGAVAPKRTSRTNSGDNYLNMVQVNAETLIGAQFFDGRLDAFRLQEPGKSNCKLATCPGTVTRCCLPRNPSAQSDEDLRMSPVGMTVASAPDGFLLYVGAGADNRVRTYGLKPNGLFRSRDPIDRTEHRKGSFPNAVAIAPSDACPP